MTITIFGFIGILLGYGLCYASMHLIIRTQKQQIELMAPQLKETHDKLVGFASSYADLSVQLINQFQMDKMVLPKDPEGGDPGMMGGNLEDLEDV